MAFLFHGMFFKPGDIDFAVEVPRIADNSPVLHVGVAGLVNDIHVTSNCAPHIGYASGFFARKIFLGRNFGDFEDFLVSNLFLPLGSLVMVLFCSYRFGWGFDNYQKEANTGKGMKVPAFLKPICTWILPVLVAAIILLGLI